LKSEDKVFNDDAALEGKEDSFWRVFYLEGESGRNYKTDREKVLSGDN
jgi:hypothetical protein